MRGLAKRFRLAVRVAGNPSPRKRILAATAARRGSHGGTRTMSAATKERTRRGGARRQRGDRAVQVLMFGWEFPPHQAGGLATATLGLFNEIERFAAVAAEIARTEPHDVIDCHDWITYAAAQRARQVSGRPLVAHVHATEHDRSGAGENPEIRRR